MNKLTKTDYEDIEILINTSNLIYEKYQKLLLLDENNQLNSDEFMRIIKDLKTSYDILKGIYGRIDYRKANLIVDYIVDKYHLPSYTLKQFEGKNIVYKKIITDISFRSFNQIIASIDYDVDKFVLHFLKQQIPNSTYKRELLKYKYDLIFSMANDSEHLNYYLFNDDIYLTHECAFDIHNISQFTRNEVVNSKLVEECFDIINIILNKSDIELIGPDEIIKTTILQLYLKANLQLISNDNFEGIHQAYMRTKQVETIATNIIDKTFIQEELPIHKIYFKK